MNSQLLLQRPAVESPGFQAARYLATAFTAAQAVGSLTSPHPDHNQACPWCTTTILGEIWLVLIEGFSSHTEAKKNILFITMINELDDLPV